MYKKSEMMSLLIICIMSFAMVKSLSTSKKPYLSIASWNVNGLRSLMRHDPSAKVLNNLIYDMHDVDILCLQETKLQEIHTVELENVLRSSIGAKEIFWSSSRSRKGYSGVATVVLNESIVPEIKMTHVDIGDEVGDMEGRTITLIHENYIIINVYTPNAGEGLKRLEYRTNVWDDKFSQHIKKLRAAHPSKTIVVAGDLNVAHRHIDYFNYFKPETKRSAGTTPEEQQSFTLNLLEKANLKDIFREVNPNTRKYSYFSPRKGELGRVNKEGWRLDYILVNFPSETSTDDWTTRIHSSPYIEDEINHPYSDHCPVGAKLYV